jgi:dipeptidyl aminopeptidase/acylaminoacyl peptidase
MSHELIFRHMGRVASPSFSPDGRRWAYVSDRSGRHQVWLSSIDAGIGAPLSTGGVSVLQASWSPTRPELACLVTPPLPDGAHVALLEVRGTMSYVAEARGATVSLGAWSPEGRYVGFSTDPTGKGSSHPYLFDRDRNHSERLAELDGLSEVCAIDARGCVLINQRLDRTRERLWLWSRSSGRLRELVSDGFQLGRRKAYFVPARRALAYITNAGSDLRRLCERPVDDGGEVGPERVLVEGERELDYFCWLGDRLLLVWNDHGRSRLELRGAEAALELPLEEQLVVLGLAASADGRRLAINAGTATLASNLWVYDLSAAPRLLAHTVTPEARSLSARLREPSLISLRADDGLSISGWLYVPPSPRTDRPLVLSVHGGPENQECPLYNGLYQSLLASGVAVFAPNVRGSAGFGRRFLDADQQTRRWRAIADVATCARHARQVYGAGPRALGVFGVSYGGYLALMTLAADPDLFGAAAVMSAFSDFQTYFATTSAWYRQASFVKYGDPATDAAWMSALSVRTRAFAIRAPVYVCHGVRDTNVHVDEARQLVAELRRHRRTVVYRELPDEGHGIAKVSNRSTISNEIVEWFCRYLGAP